MTIGMWTIIIIIGLCGIGGAVAFIACGVSKRRDSEEGKREIVAGIVTLILTAAILTAVIWWFNNSASGMRWKKDFDSAVNNGIERTITVYDVKGKEIEKYHGKFDIDEGTGQSGIRIKFDDEKGDRHIIYCTTGTVIVTEGETE